MLIEAKQPGLAAGEWPEATRCAAPVELPGSGARRRDGSVEIRHCRRADAAHDQDGQTNRILLVDSGGSFACRRLREIVRPETAELLATYGEDFYAGMPVVTRNRFGAGYA
jgi:hypothetical protein